MLSLASDDLYGSKSNELVYNLSTKSMHGLHNRILQQEKTVLSHTGRSYNLQTYLCLLTPHNEMSGFLASWPI